MTSQHSAPATTSHAGLERAPRPGTGFSVRQTFAAVAVAAIIAAFGGAAVYAATDSSSHNFGPGVHGALSDGWAAPGGMHGRGGAPAGR